MPSAIPPLSLSSYFSPRGPNSRSLNRSCASISLRASTSTCAPQVKWSRHISEPVNLKTFQRAICNSRSRFFIPRGLLLCLFVEIVTVAFHNDLDLLVWNIVEQDRKIYPMVSDLVLRRDHNLCIFWRFKG